MDAKDGLDIDDPKTHALRVAALIRAFEAGKPMRPIVLGVWGSRDDPTVLVDDGRHRLRALKWLNLEWIPVTVDGDMDIFQDLVLIEAGVPDEQSDRSVEEVPSVCSAD